MAPSLSLVLLACLGLWAQPSDKLEFEVASIKPVPPYDGHSMITVSCRGGPGTDDPEAFICQNMSLANLVTRAYGIPHYRLSMPDWMQGMEPMFQVTAKIPPGTTKDQFEMMLQNLLADRFKLAVHDETRDFTTYQLTVAKNGPKFKEAGDPPPPTDAGHPSPAGVPKTDKDGYPIIDARGGMAIRNGRARLHQPQMTIERLVSQLSAQLGSPVTDATGLRGKYDITLFWTAQPMRASADAADSDPGPPLIQAVQEQLGLRLESKKGPVDFVVIDHVEKVPTEN